MRVAVCQMNGAADDVDANVQTAERLLREAVAGGAELAALPELFNHYGSHRRMREVAVMKTVGATRGTLVRMLCTEFAVIGSAAGLGTDVGSLVEAVLEDTEPKRQGGPGAMPAACASVPE